MTKQVNFLEAELLPDSMYALDESLDGTFADAGVLP